MVTDGGQDGFSLEDVFDAYFKCRIRKRNSCNAIEFEADYERKCIDLWQEINSRTYHPSRSIAFVVTKPVRREVFAADFRDRVVHHLIAGRIEPLFERQFIHDAYSTRKKKGTLYGIQRLEYFIRSCSEDYTKDCYVMKIDIQSFFMSIPKDKLYQKVERFLKLRYEGADLPLLLYLLRETVFNCPEKNCVRKSDRSEWDGLPPGKSLFYTDGNRGLPIGNLTSQLLAQFYLDELDHLVTEQWGVKYYGRYVDDMVLVHPLKKHLLEVRSRIARWLEWNGLKLHPNKMYLQHYTKGVLFIGGMVLPGRKYIGKRTVGECYEAIDRQNRLAARYPDYVRTHGEEFVSTVNSYLGVMRHFASFSLRQKLMKRVGSEWWKIVWFAGHIEKVVLKTAYKPVTCKMQEVHEVFYEKMETE